MSVRDYLLANHMSDACQSWLRATALGGVTGTLNMTVWELFHRFRGNLRSVFGGAAGELFWNAQPPNSPEGFLPRWERALVDAGVEVALGERATSILPGPQAATSMGQFPADAVFLALPPPALAAVLGGSPDGLSRAFGHSPQALQVVLRESVYAHLGLLWLFDQPLPTDLPLGGHNVLRGWHPILVQHSQYGPWLKAPARTAVVGSISTRTDFRHPRLGTLAREHEPRDLARIVWQDERAADPSLPEPIETIVLGVSSATQIVRHGALPVKAAGQAVYLATNLNGLAPYFTASLESAIQAGAATAAAFDPSVERLPTGPAASRGAAGLPPGAAAGLRSSRRSGERSG